MPEEFARKIANALRKRPEMQQWRISHHANQIFLTSLSERFEGSPTHLLINAVHEVARRIEREEAERLNRPNIDCFVEKVYGANVSNTEPTVLKLTYAKVVPESRRMRGLTGGARRRLPSGS